jgi:asparagine synthase (glutamine-hydrolysing)
MCGIIGVAYSARARDVPEDLLRAMTGVIRHRGPDDEGWHRGAGVGIGMRRLSIIDLAGGHQPIYNEDGRCVIVFNGEIYNHAELRADLVARGHVFRTHSDTEAILHAWEEYGERCVERLRGMFAIAIWDARTETLFLARDRFGMKPLLYVTGAWGIAFASELPALVAGGFTERQLDLESVSAYFQLGYIPTDQAIYRDVRKLLPAHTLLWRRGSSPQIAPYWALPALDRDRLAPSDEELLAALDESVKSHLVSDVPIAAFLSGGMDSSAIVSSAALQGNRAHAFTVRYRGSGAADSDETPLARALAERYGVPLSVIDVDPDVRDVFPRILGSLDEPIADESAVPSWFVYERVAREFKVALAGTGGDELFVGYHRHAAMLLDDRMAHVPASVRRAAGRLVAMLPEPRGTSLTLNRVKRYLRTGGEGSAARRYLDYLSKSTVANRRALFSGDLVAAASNGLPERFDALAREVAPSQGLRTALTLDYKVYLPDDLLALSDRLSMAHSLEVRMPFVDHVLVEGLFALDERKRMTGREPKGLLRRALRSRIPAAHFSAPKRGFVGATASWLRHEMRDMVIDELSPTRLASLGLFQPVQLQRLVDEHLTLKQNHEGMLWALLTFVGWLDAHRSAPTVTGC